MEKLDVKLYKENSFNHSFHQTILSSSLLQPSMGDFLSYDRCDYEGTNHHDYNKLSSIRETHSVCTNCKRKYVSRNLLENLDSNTKELIRANLQNEWKLIALIADRFLFWIFSTLTFFSTVILLVIVPLVVRNDQLVKPKST